MRVSRKIFRILLLLIAAFCMSAFAKAGERTLERTLPTLTIPEALQIAQLYLEEKKLDISDKFISSVRYHESGVWTQSYMGKGPYWQVTYEPKEHSCGGQYFVLVYMDRKVGHIGGL
jgi:hypothetical protein